MPCRRGGRGKTRQGFEISGHSGNGATQHKAATVNGLLCNFPPRLKTCHHPAGSTQDIYRFLNKNKTETFPVNALRHLPS